MASLPYISVQPNYDEAFNDLCSPSAKIQQEKCWLSYYSQNSPSGSVHAKVLLEAAKESDDEDGNTQGGVRIANVETSGGPTNGLKIRRVKGNRLDLEVYTNSPPEQTATSLDKAHSSQDPSQEGEGEGEEEYHDGLGIRSARSLQPSIHIPSRVRIRFPSEPTLSHILPTTRTSKVNDNYTNHPTIDAFDCSPNSNLYCAGGNDGALYVGSLPSSSTSSNGVNRDKLRQNLIAELSESDQLALRGDQGEEKKWEVEAKLRIAINSQLVQSAHSSSSSSSTSSKKLQLKGHVGDIRSIRFFPSGKVILSTSSDLTTRIWDAATGDNPRTLTGHKRAVTTAGILGKGRNVLTGSLDGTVRLFDVSQPKQIRLLGSDRWSPVNCIALPSSNGGGQEGEGDAEAEEQHLFVAGLQSGKWELFDLRTPGTSVLKVDSQVFPPGPPPRASDLWGPQHPSKSISAVDVDMNSNVVVTGSTSGIVSVWDIRTLSSSSDAAATTEAATTTTTTTPRKGLLSTWKRNNAEVTALKLVPSNNHNINHTNILIATNDGLPYEVQLPLSTSSDDTSFLTCPTLTTEFGTWDCEPTTFIGRDWQNKTIIAGAEGRVCRY